MKLLTGEGLSHVNHPAIVQQPASRLKVEARVASFDYRLMAGRSIDPGPYSSANGCRDSPTPSPNTGFRRRKYFYDATGAFHSHLYVESRPPTLGHDIALREASSITFFSSAHICQSHQERIHPFISDSVQVRAMANQELREITRDTPLRLADAIEIAFPHGGMTVSGLRRERDRNRLVVERIAGKEFTTLAHIERMRELCRVEAKASASNSEQRDGTAQEKSHTRQLGGSAITAGISAQAALQMKLRPRSKS
ncbi:MAG TPA: hypothetical protein VGC26_03880 [Afipia sp.]